jgi:hypothetical protein
MALNARIALEFVVAHLRLASREGGLAIDVRGGRAYTPELRELVERGDLAMQRPNRGSKNPTVLHATPQGLDRLAGILERYGEAFGPIDVLGRLENVRKR